MVIMPAQNLAPPQGADLSGANLSGANLRNAKLSQVPDNARHFP